MLAAVGAPAVAGEAAGAEDAAGAGDAALLLLSPPPLPQALTRKRMLTAIAEVRVCAPGLIPIESFIST